MQTPGNAVVKLSTRHQAIMDFLIANPDLPHSVVAAQFQVTEPWLSTLIHSELFQMELRYKQDVAFSDIVVSVKDRLNNLAHTSLRRLQERLELGAVTNDTLVDVSEMALKSLGFGQPKFVPQGPSAPVFNQQINNFGSTPVDAALLAGARARMLTVVPPIDAHAVRVGAAPPETLSGVSQDVHRDGDTDNDNGLEVGESQEIAAERGSRPGLERVVEPSLAQAGPGETRDGG